MDTMEPTDNGLPKRKKPKKARDLGKLHALLIRGLPDWIDEGGLLRVYDLAKYLGISYQALYKICERERISSRRMVALLKLSRESKKPFNVNMATNEPYGPLTTDDFMEFL